MVLSLIVNFLHYICKKVVQNILTHATPQTPQLPNSTKDNRTFDSAALNTLLKYCFFSSVKLVKMSKQDGVIRGTSRRNKKMIERF